MTKIPTYEEIKPYIEKRYVSEQAHPAYPNVRIFNYTQHCQFEQAWDDITRQCRGLILNVETGEVLARPFPKFFNYGEHVSKGWAIPTTHPVVMEKLDGSLGILYQINGIEYIATRGSFTSDQAIWATNWWHGMNRNQSFVITKGVTHLFEIIYPQNRIVVNYDYSGLVFLAAIDNETGKQVEGGWAEPVRTANIVPYTDMETLEKMDEPNSEGFVLYYPEENVRMKVKFPEYVRLHKLVTGVNEIAIWEHLRQGQTLNDLVQKVPDEFFQWVSAVSKRLMGEWAKRWGDAQLAVQMVQGMPTRKEQAVWIMENRKEVAGIVFSLLDGQERKAALQTWRMVRPHGNRPFTVDIDV